MREQIEGFGISLKMPLRAYFLMREQVRGFGLPLKMSLLATILCVGGSGKLPKDMGNYILAGVRNLSISHSQNDQKCIFEASFGQLLPFQAH